MPLKKTILGPLKIFLKFISYTVKTYQEINMKSYKSLFLLLICKNGYFCGKYGESF
jgi:hypothetical protein